MCGMGVVRSEGLAATAVALVAWARPYFAVFGGVKDMRDMAALCSSQMWVSLSLRSDCNLWWDWIWRVQLGSGVLRCGWGQIVGDKEPLLNL